VAYKEKADIDYYLQRGFSHDQVIRLCADGTGSNGMASAPQDSSATATTRTAPAQSLNYPQNNDLTADRVYFETVLNAQSANLTPENLSYTSKECVEYGEVNLGGLRDKACVNTQVTVNFKGLEIIKAVKGIFLIRDQKMIVQGDIQREYLNYNSLSAGKQAVVRAQLPTRPHRLNLPVLKGIDPKQVASRLKKYITQ